MELSNFLVGPGVAVDLSNVTGDYQIYTAQVIEERAEVREGDMLIIRAECIGGDIDLLINRRTRLTFSPGALSTVSPALSATWQCWTTRSMRS